MDEQIIASRYAVALADAVTSQQWDASLDEIKCMVVLLDEVPCLRGLLVSPIVPHNVRKEVLIKLLEHVKFSEKVRNFISILFSKGRLMLIQYIGNAMAAEINERRHMMTAMIKSAFPLSAEEKKRIIEKISSATGKTLEASIEEDSSLLGGVLVQVGHTIYDYTLKNKLLNLGTALQLKP